ncbi:MAG: hypothetical protein H6935_02700 [Thiobacillus sp.]|nr:hypothetical protein [Thiobacillus sp.]
MFSEQLAIMLFLAATHATNPQAMVPSGPAVEDARHAVMRAVKEPELVAALSLRVKRLGLRKRNAVSSQTMLASVE